MEFWSVAALQLDLLDNKPTVALRSNWGTEAIFSPYQLITESIEVDLKAIFTAGYLSGFSDRHHGKALGAAIVAEGLGSMAVPCG